MNLQIPAPWRIWMRSAGFILFGIVLLVHAAGWTFCHDFCDYIIRAVAIGCIIYGGYLTQFHKKILSTIKRLPS